MAVLGQKPVAYPEGPEDVRPEDQAVVNFLAVATAAEPRHSEGDIVALTGGRLFAAYTRYHAGEGWDTSPAHIVSRTSDDGGRSWTEPRVIAEPDDPQRGNAMSVSLLRGVEGGLLMAYIDQTPQMPARGLVLRRSSDAGDTWGEREVISPAGSPRMHAANNACLLRLSTGRILLAAREYADYRRPYALISDDDGHKWHAGQWVPDADLTCQQRAEQNVNEPSVCELADGRLLMTMRSMAGGQFFAWSSDAGETWTKPVLSPLRGRCSPCALRRLPGSKDVLAIWTPGFHQRTPLASAISSDGGQTWHHFRYLERSPYHGYCYASCTFAAGRALLSYMHYPIRDEVLRFNSEPRYHDLRFVSLPLAWFWR